MAIRIAINHKTEYRYDRLVSLSPHVVRLRPAVHTRTPIHSYSLKIGPEKHFINWQQDPFGNYLARLVFTEKTRVLSVEVDLVAEMVVINPFDFFLDEYAKQYPFKYSERLNRELNAVVTLDLDTAREAADGAEGVIAGLAAEALAAGDWAGCGHWRFLFQ